MDYLVTCAWPRDKAALPALNNLAFKGREVNREPKDGIAQIQQECQERLARLEADFRDEAA